MELCSSNPKKRKTRNGSKAMREDKMNSEEQLDLLIARAKETGVLTERLRIIKLLKANKVLRVDALGSLVFVNCDTMEVEYLPNLLLEGIEN